MDFELAQCYQRSGMKQFQLQFGGMHNIAVLGVLIVAQCTLGDPGYKSRPLFFFFITFCSSCSLFFFLLLKVSC